MLVALQPLLKFILISGATVGVVFMIMCTAFIIISFIRGDIKTNMVRNETEKEIGQEK